MHLKGDYSMIFCVDVDGTLNNLMDAVLEIFNEQTGSSYTVSDITTYNLGDCFSVEEAATMKSIFEAPDIWSKVKPLKGAAEALQKLINDGHQIYLVTDNCPNTYGEKVAWIRRFFPFIDSSKIVCMKDKWQFRCDVMIEDNLQTLLARPYYHRILIDHPWNSAYEYRDFAYDIYRCKNWNDVLSAVNKIIETESDVN